MKLIYKNNYGTTYSIASSSDLRYTMQMVINNIGIFMSSAELNNLLNVVRSSYGVNEVCNCEQCKGERLNKLWKSNPFLDIGLKVDDTILSSLEDLILGTQFILNVDSVLQENRIQ